VLLACLTVAPPARADGPVLLIRLTTGERATYAVSEVQRIVFDGDTLVVVKAGGAERYAAAAISKIEFVMEFSSVNDPREAQCSKSVPKSGHGLDPRARTCCAPGARTGCAKGIGTGGCGSIS
jgi:hypothetical protein